MPKTLPFADIQVVTPGYGTMSLSGIYGPADDVKSLAALAKAKEIGCVFWDTAIVYGLGENERFIGDFLKKNGGREKIFVASKCGFDIDFATKTNRGVLNSAEHISQSVEGTIERLGFTPDLYYLHRIEPGRDLKESIGALAKLRTDGKTKYIGLSECSAETLRKANSIAHIDALQIEYSPWFTDHEDNGLIDTARELGIAIVAFSPLGAGILTGAYTDASQFANDFRGLSPRFQKDTFDANFRLVKGFQELASKKGCSPGNLAIAWVQAQGAIPIPGTRSAERLEQNFKATNVELDESELKEIRTLIEHAKPKGNRFNDAVMSAVGH